MLLIDLHLIIKAKLLFLKDQLKLRRIYLFLFFQLIKDFYLFFPLKYQHSVLLFTMERHQTHLLDIYSQTNALVLAKRQLLRSLAHLQIPSSSLQEEQHTSSTKLYLCLSKLAAELKRALEEFAAEEGGQCLRHLTQVAQGLKNDRQLYTQEETMIAQLKTIRQRWEEEKDPLIHYEQGEREAVRRQLTQKLRELERWQQLGHSSKKPLYVRKLERELRDNLERVAHTERAFNRRQQGLYLAARGRLLRVTGRLAGAVGRMNRESLVNEEKNDLLRNYIDLFNDGSRVSERQLEGYRQDYLRTLHNITQIFKQELHCFSILLDFTEKVEAAGNISFRGVLSAEEEFSNQMQHTSEAIFTIVSPKEVIEVVHNCKHFLTFARQWEKVKGKIARAKIPLQEAICAVRQITTRMNRDSGKQRRGSAVQQFIQDKKFMETLVKKESQFQEGLFEIWQSFLQSYLRVLEATPQQLEGERGRSRLEGAFDRLFESYLGEAESERKNEMGPSLRHSNKAFIGQIEQLIESISVFSEEVEWQGSYQCSLGPRLLIHGRVKVLPEGIYYQSSFNQKNYFFGRTRIFLPKEQIFQVNKQTVLIFFPDVLEVVTKFGSVFFHALGKRETMYQHFISTYLPEVNNNQTCQEQLEFNPFTGDLALVQQRIQPFLKPLETEMAKGKIQNIDLRSFFHKYYSNQEFYYQGRSYKDFKYYMCILAHGRNIRCSDFTPGIPEYLQLASQPALGKDIEESERLITYDRDVPSIPFVAKGGDGICQEKNIFRWGGPKCFVIDVYATVGGFSLTEGMTVKSRQVFREVGGSVEMQVSAEVDFVSSSPMNSMIRAPALSNLKDFHLQVIDKQTKLERNRGNAVAGGKKADLREECEQQGEKIQQLECQLAKLKKTMKLMVGVFAVVYILTLSYFNLRQ